MLRESVLLLLMGLAAAFFFSTTFVLNRVMALEGGHWFWSAALRYLYMVLLLSAGLALFKGPAYLRALGREFIAHGRFWCLAGGVGFAGFYALLCFAAAGSPGWVVATTWQLTLVASLLVLTAFGRTIALRTWLLTLLVVAGVSLVNLDHFAFAPFEALALNVGCILLAACCYPLGNQLVWEARRGRAGLPVIDRCWLDNAFAKVLLLSLGSLPCWALLGALVDVGAPSRGQLISVAWVALCSGVIATSLFLAARQRADTPGRLALVDATQSGEVLFALGAEQWLLATALPSWPGVAGLLLTLAGLLALVFSARH